VRTPVERTATGSRQLLSVGNAELAKRARNGPTKTLEYSGLRAEHGAVWRTDGQDCLYIWLAVDSKAREPYRGGAFTLEFERSDDCSRLNKLAGRVLLGQLLTLPRAILVVPPTRRDGESPRLLVSVSRRWAHWGLDQSHSKCATKRR
jgi:hypothetical protein